jgi:monovalent cation:H+ antiporter-2, CPA2 family
VPLTSYADPFTLTLASASASEARVFIDLFVMLATAAVVATIFKKLRLATIPGYLIAGAIVGPFALKLVGKVETVEQISRLAIILLMFTIGLMLETGSLRRGMLSILAVGAVSTALVVLAAWPTSMLFGPSAPQALAIAMAFSMSSTAILLRVLQERREFRQPHGQLCLGVAIVQDIVSVILLAALPLIVAWDQGASQNVVQGGRSMNPAALWAMRLGAVACIIILGRVGLPRLLNLVARADKSGTGGSELVLVLSAALAVAAALALGSLGFSPEMGAFLAGFMLSFTPFRHQLAGQLAPMKDLLMAVFFTSVGLQIDPAVLVNNWAHVLFGVAILIVGKAVLVGATAWALGASGSVALLGGIYLANAGEFSLVIVNGALAAGLFERQGVATVIAIVVVSLVISPMLVGPAHRWAIAAGRLPLAPWIRRSAMRAGTPTTHEHADKTHAENDSPHDANEPHPHHLGRHVIIAGYGPVGRTLADRLRKRGISIAVIELNPKTVHKQSRRGMAIVYGDVTNPEVLESAGIREADALVLTVPDELATVRACQIAKSMAPDVFIAARTNYLSQAIQARKMGADSVIVEEIATADAMGDLVVELLETRRPGTQAPGAPATADSRPPTQSNEPNTSAPDGSH